MKTFNSIFANGNVKSIIAIATVAISSVFGLSSCDKNDDAFVEPAGKQQTIVPEAQNPETVHDAYLYVAAINDQTKYIDATYTISFDGQTKVVKLSDMNEVKDAKQLNNTMMAFQTIDSTPTENGKVDKDDTKVYEYHIGNIKNTKSTKIESIYLTALSAKADHNVKIFTGAEIMANNHSLCVFGNLYHRGVTDIASFVEAFNTEY